MWYIFEGKSLDDIWDDSNPGFISITKVLSVNQVFFLCQTQSSLFSRVLSIHLLFLRFGVGSYLPFEPRGTRLLHHSTFVVPYWRIGIIGQYDSYVQPFRN